MYRSAIAAVAASLVTMPSFAAVTMPSRSEQLKNLQAKQILVYMWGWSPEEMAPAAKKFGYQVLHAPSGNDVNGKAHEVEVFSKAGFKMIARPFMVCKDPFDSDEVREGCQELRRVIGYYDPNPNIIGFAIA